MAKSPGPSFGWLVFWLAVLLSGGFSVHLEALPTSTTPEPRPPELKLSSEKDFDEALLTLRGMLQASLADSLKLRNEADALRQDLEAWQVEALRLSSDLTASRTASEALSNSLTDSLLREEALSLASQERARLDGQAVDQARGSLFWWGVGSAAAGAVIGWLLHW